jgi:hypothetical protein
VVCAKSPLAPPPTQPPTGAVPQVSATIAGKNVGIAPRATIHSVRVLNCVGDGLLSDVIAALEWVAVNAQRPAIATLSLGIKCVHPTPHSAGVGSGFRWARVFGFRLRVSAD